MSLSIPRSRVRYDLAYVIVEKWLLGFLSEDEDEDSNELGFEFSKIMMINRQFKEIFLRLFKQNFGSCSLDIGLSFHRMDFGFKENDGKISAPLFQDLSLENRDKIYAPLLQDFSLNGDCYGTIKNKWFYAFLRVNDISLFVKAVMVNKDLLEENYRSFGLSENIKESLLHFVYSGENEFEKVINAGIKMDVDDKSLLNALHCGCLKIRDPAPGMIRRLFNLNADDVHLSFEPSLNSHLSNDIQQLRQLTVMDDTLNQVLTRKILVWVQMKDRCTAHIALSSPVWRSVAMYALEICSQLELLEIRICLPAKGFEENVLANLVQLLDWFKKEVLPKFPSDANFELRMNLYIDFGMNNRLLAFMREQKISFAENYGYGHRFSYNADSRFNLEFTSA